jgi:hypothetical protein
MATTYKILSSLAPAATADTTLYTVPSATEAVIATLAICNRGTAATTYRINTRTNGTATSNSNYLAFDAPIGGNDTVALTLGISLGDTDVVSVFAGNANLTFQAFGAEITA